jgi:hypothetical protein
MTKIYILDVCKHIINLQHEIDGEIASKGGYDADAGTLLGDCRDYCMFYVLDRLRDRTADVADIISELMDCERYSTANGDRMHSGFFFALSQMLALKYEVQTLPGEAIDRKSFETSWKKTCRELGL